MANGPSFFGSGPDYGLSQDIIRLLGLSPEGHIGGEIVYHDAPVVSAGVGDTVSVSHDYGMFDPFNEGMIATALAKKYGLSGEEQANLFKSGMFQPLSRSIVQTLDPKKYINELRATRTQTPAGFLSQQAMMSPDMMGSGSARKAAMDARGALRRKRQEEIAKASGQLSGQKDSILAQITSWDEAARQAANQAQVGQFRKQKGLFG
tara:strand:- start:426 stop:1043 length:618 start_codon:yes stop_codon:yes gene_type:complete